MGDHFDDHTPLSLKKACHVFFHDQISPATLRAEARRGRLSIARVGRKDFVTIAALKKLLERSVCQDVPNPRASTSVLTRTSGSSEMDRSQSAQAAALRIAQELKKLSAPTSPPNSLQ
jgi:hypothetical protein